MSFRYKLSFLAFFAREMEGLALNGFGSLRHSSLWVSGQWEFYC